MNFIRTIFKKWDNTNFNEAKKRLADVQEKLESNPKILKFKEIYITEFHY